jgi:hypothetical protein
MGLYRRAANLEKTGTGNVRPSTKLRMRDFLSATRIAPQPELVEGRRIVMQQVWAARLGGVQTPTHIQMPAT